MLRVVLLALALLAPGNTAPSWGQSVSSAALAPLGERMVLPLRAVTRCAGAYDAPVDAPVVDPFRLPEGTYRAGNRGLEYGTVAGMPVRSIGPGEVSFAGRIAGSWHVTVRHADGLRSSYAFLASVTVVEGRRVAVGEVVGHTGERFLHLGVRDAAGYLDPAPLLGGRARAWLIPLRRFGDGGGCLRSGAASVRTLTGAALANR